MTQQQNSAAVGAPPTAPSGRTRVIRRALDLWGTWGIALVLLLLIVLMALIAPNFVSLSNAFNIMRATSITAILAAGVTVVILTAGIDLSVGSVLAVCGVSSVLLWNAGVPVVLCVLVPIVLGALIGLLHGTLVAYLSLAAFIVTLAGLTAWRGTAYALTGGRPLIAEGDLGFDMLGGGNFIAVPVPIWLMLATYAVLWFLLERTTFGRHVYAVGGNPEAALMAGIKVKRVLTSVYIISGVTAGLAGVMLAARVESGQPNSGQGYELEAIAAVVLGGTSLMGGRGRILGTLVGALIMGVLSNGMILMNTPFFTQLIVQGLVIVVAVAIDSLKNRYTT
ncbi:ABC transporter permease subunit [Georgenia alba]|uniref:Ribose ABC transporter permease n=1 Tax=Georgenia alba TaxID=2233858 RepID=A0ABW2QGE8_9MICO